MSIPIHYQLSKDLCWRRKIRARHTQCVFVMPRLHMLDTEFLRSALVLDPAGLGINRDRGHKSVLRGSAYTRCQGFIRVCGGALGEFGNPFRCACSRVSRVFLAWVSCAPYLPCRKSIAFLHWISRSIRGISGPWARMELSSTGPRGANREAENALVCPHADSCRLLGFCGRRYSRRFPACWASAKAGSLFM